MKLLLTSAGLTNNSIIEALAELLPYPFNEVKLAFIPTAANVEEGDKGWLINNLVEIQKLEFKSIDIVDISALPHDIWKNRLKDADVLFFSGGNTYHLMYWVKKSGLGKLLPKILKTKVYVGVSAGSMIASNKISLTQAKKFYSEEIGEVKTDDGLGLVDFQIRPHLNSPYFPNVTLENVKKIALGIKEQVYAIDDQTAIKVNGMDVSVVTRGKWKKY